MNEIDSSSESDMEHDTSETDVESFESNMEETASDESDESGGMTFDGSDFHEVDMLAVSPFGSEASSDLDEPLLRNMPFRANLSHGYNRFWNFYNADAYDSEQPEEDDSLDDTDQLNLTCHSKSPLVKQYHIKSNINVVDLLQSKETGECRFESNLRSIVMSYILAARWSEVSYEDMLIEVKSLLGRKLFGWEFGVLNFLHLHGMKTPYGRQSRQESSSRTIYSIKGIAPISFIDIVNSVIRFGVSFDCRDETGDDLLLAFVKHKELTGNVVDFFEFLFRQGYDVNNTGDGAVKEICHSFRQGSISKVKMRMIKLLFDAGLNLTERTKQTLLTKFIRYTRDDANRIAIEVLKLLVRNGCQANKALVAFDCLDFPIIAPHLPGRFECILEMANILVRNGAQVKESPGKWWTRTYLFRMLDVAAKETAHSSMMWLFAECIRRGFDLRTTYRNGEHLLMAVCLHYKCEDLPDVVRFLCNSGMDVHHVDRLGRNALLCLTENEPVHRRAIWDAVRVLMEFNISVKPIDWPGYTPLTLFLSTEMQEIPCCYYQGLKYCSESGFLSALILIVEAGVDVNSLTEEAPRQSALELFLQFLDELCAKPCDICEQCLKNDFALVSKEAAIITLNTSLLEEPLKFTECLIKAAANINENFSDDHTTALHYVCRYFTGELLISLVRLLCDSGVDVNAKTPHLMVNLTDGPQTELCAIDVYRICNHNYQANLADCLLEIMKSHGYKGCV